MPARKKNEKKKTGPKPFSPTKAQIMRYWRMKKRGWRDVDIAESFGIGLSTFNRAKKKFGMSGLGNGQRGYRGHRDKPDEPNIGLTPLIRRQLILLSENGLTKEKSAEIAGISGTTLWKWFKIDPTLKHDMEVAKERAVQDAINALRSRVLGFDTVTVSETTEVDREGKERVVNRHRTKHRVLPSVPAAKLYLANMAQWVTDAKNIVGGSGDGEETEYDIREKLYDEAEDRKGTES